MPALPPNYILYEDLMTVLEGLENATASVRSPSTSTAEMVNEHSRFSQTINDDLLRNSSMPERRINLYRRSMIEDCYRIAALIYISAIAKFMKDGQIESERLIQHLRSELIDPSTDWAYPVEMMLRLPTWWWNGALLGKFVLCFAVDGHLLNGNYQFRFHYYKIPNTLFGILIIWNACYLECLLFGMLSIWNTPILY